MYNPLYDNEMFGEQYTLRFTQVFDSAETFYTEWNASGIAETAADLGIEMSEDSIKLIYFLLYSRYGNSHISSILDINQFKYKVWSIIYQYGPLWKRKMELQTAVRALTPEDMSGNKRILNHAFNPGTAPSTATLTELLTINEQNTATNLRSKGDAYAMLMDLLDRDYTEEFLGKFKPLFLKFVGTTVPLVYTSDN